MTTALRITYGSPTPAELAAVTAVLLGRTHGSQPGTASAEPTGTRLSAAGWQRYDRVPGFDGPRTWRAAADRPHRSTTRGHYRAPASSSFPH